MFLNVRFIDLVRLLWNFSRKVYFFTIRMLKPMVVTEEYVNL